MIKMEKMYDPARREALVADLRALTEELRADELPVWLCERAQSLHFYARSRAASVPEERFLALYNALGTLLGFPAAKAHVEQLLGRAEHALSAARGDEEGSGVFPYCTDELDRLAASLRRQLLAR